MAAKFAHGGNTQHTTRSTPRSRMIVLRGITAFGGKGAVHSADLPRLMVDLPLVIEFNDQPEVAQAAIASLDLVPAGHIVNWPANCPNFKVRI
jgi:PII-like signaling protein